MTTHVVLSVEDDDAAFRLLEIAFHEAQPDTQLLRVRDGEEALQFLQRANHHHNAPRPELILLNLNLPKKSGMEVLAEIAADESLRSIPVTIFTTSSWYIDKTRAQALGAQDFITKPTTFTGLVDAVKSACARVASA